MESIGSQTQVTTSAKQLKMIESKQQADILFLQNKIQSIRNQLKTLSNSASKIIQKKLITPKGTKPRPVFNPSYQSRKLQQIKDQKQKIFHQIDQTKSLIQSIKLQQEPEVKSEIIKRQTKIKQVERLSQKAIQEKKYVIEELQANKQKISAIKESACNKDMAQNQKVLQQCKKEKVLLEKKLNNFTSQQILAGLYILELKSKIQFLDQTVDQKSTNHVSIQQINTLISEINDIIATRNQIEKEKSKQISELTNQIAQLQRENSRLTNSYRQLEGEIMKRNLEERFYKSKIQKVSKSTDFLDQNKQYSSVYAYKNAQTDTNKPKLKSHTKPFKTSKFNQNLIEIGSFDINDKTNDNTKLLKDSLDNPQSIQKVYSITFILLDNKIVGVKSNYQNKEGKRVSGQVLSVENLEKGVEKEIIVKEIKEIEYPVKSKQICLKFIKFNGSIQTVGTQYYGATQKSSISLKNIRSVEFVVQKSKEGIFEKAKGVIIHLESKVPIDKSLKVEQREEEVKQSVDGVFLTSSPSGLRKKAQSIDSISTYKTKVVLKPLKKQTESSLDHRLLIRKKLV